MKKTRIQTPKEEFTSDYPEALEFADKQSGVFWPFYEVKVEKDKQDFLVNLTQPERDGVVEVLRLFSKYEAIIGNEFWINFVMKKYPRPADIQPMAALFGAIELAVHQKFYSKLNEELGLATDEFYNAYKEDPELKERIDFLENTLSTKDDLHALGCFTFGEGAILYTSFAYLKHFQSGGKNKLLNVVSGINFSARDEDLHSQAAAWLFKQHLKESIEADIIDSDYVTALKEDIYLAAKTVYEHECVIARKIFNGNKIDGITQHQLECFAQSRINYCLRNLGYENLFEVKYNPVADWFYDGISGYQMQDFFNSQGNSYERGWDENGFVF